MRAELEAGGSISVEQSHEYGADIIRACETGEPFTFNGNVPNRCDGRAADRQPARGLLRRGAVRGVGATGSSRSRSARCRASSPR